MESAASAFGFLFLVAALPVHFAHAQGSRAPQLWVADHIPDWLPVILSGDTFARIPDGAVPRKLLEAVHAYVAAFYPESANVIAVHYAGRKGFALETTFSGTTSDGHSFAFVPYAATVVTEWYAGVPWNFRKDLCRSGCASWFRMSTLPSNDTRLAQGDTVARVPPSVVPYRILEQVQAITICGGGTPPASMSQFKFFLGRFGILVLALPGHRCETGAGVLLIYDFAGRELMRTKYADGSTLMHPIEVEEPRALR